MPLSLAQAEAIFASIFRASVSATIAGDVLTIAGSGRYKILPQSGTADQITSIVLTGEAVEGTLIQLRPQTTGHIITLIHAGSLHLLNGRKPSLSTIYTTIWLRHHGANIWAQEGPVSYTS